MTAASLRVIDAAAAELAAIDPDDVPGMADVRALLGETLAGRPPANIDPNTGEVLSLNLPASFYDARPELDAIRRHAHARYRPADAVFGAVLARVAVLTPPTIKGPAPVGMPCSLNVIVALIGPSGAGKSSSVDVAEKVLTADPLDPVPTVSLGSGEGLVEAYMGTVDEVQDGKTRKVRRQVRTSVLFMLDEGQALAEMTNRKGSTLTSVLRSAATGQRIGQANASDERTRQLPANEYRMALLAGFQYETALPVIDDAKGGTPQRFLWFSAVDPTIPDNPEPAPDPLDWSPPRRPAGPLDLHPDIAAEIRSRSVAAARGHMKPPELDAHRDLNRLKVAALLSLLAGRHNIDPDDWRLAGIVLDTSDRVRGEIIATAQAHAAQKEAAVRRRDIGRAHALETSQEARALDVMASAVARYVHRRAGESGCKRGELTRATPSKYRALVTIDAAIEEAEARGWIVTEGDRYRPGGSRPAASGGHQ